jgi:hypothetical protein
LSIVMVFVGWFEWVGGSVSVGGRVMW